MVNVVISMVVSIVINVVVSIVIGKYGMKVNDNEKGTFNCVNV